MSKTRDELAKEHADGYGAGTHVAFESFKAGYDAGHAQCAESKDARIKELEDQILSDDSMYRARNETCARFGSKITAFEEKLKIAVKALEYYANDPFFNEKNHIAIGSNFRSNNCAQYALKEISALATLNPHATDKDGK